MSHGATVVRDISSAYQSFFLTNSNLNHSHNQHLLILMDPVCRGQPEFFEFEPSLARIPSN